MYPQVGALANLYGGYNGVQTTGGPQGISSPGGLPTTAAPVGPAPALQPINQRFMNMQPQQAALAQYMQAQQPQQQIQADPALAQYQQQAQLAQQQYQMMMTGQPPQAAGYAGAPMPLQQPTAQPLQQGVNIAGAQFGPNGQRIQPFGMTNVPAPPVAGMQVQYPQVQYPQHHWGGGNGIGGGAHALAHYYQR